DRKLFIPRNARIHNSANEDHTRLRSRALETLILRIGAFQSHPYLGASYYSLCLTDASYVLDRCDRDISRILFQHRQILASVKSGPFGPEGILRRTAKTILDTKHPVAARPCCFPFQLGHGASIEANDVARKALRTGFANRDT